MELRLLPGKPIPLSTGIRLLGLSCSLCLSGLLQAAFKLCQLRGPRGCLLCDAAQALPRTGSLPASFFELATDIGEFPGSGQDGLLPIRDLLLKCGETLLRLRQLFLERGKPLVLGLNTPPQFISSLLGSLHGLLRRAQLRLGLLTGLSHLGELLFGALEILPERAQLGLKLIPRLCGLRHLLLSSRHLGLELTLLATHLRLQVALLLFESPLLRRQLVPGRGQRGNPFLKLALLLRETLPLRT